LLVVSTGGLGPTDDDRTREAVAASLGLEVSVRSDVLKDLVSRWSASGRTMPRSNRRQAAFPAGAEPLPNPEGTAPGIWVSHPGGVIVALPGPPIEMRAVFDGDLQQRLKERFDPPPVATRTVRTAGMAESALEDRIQDLYSMEGSTEITVLAQPGVVDLHILSRGVGADSASERVAGAVRERLGSAVFATDDRPLAAVVGARLRELGKTVAVAESCTGGLLGGELTEVPGSSEYFLGGVVAYADRVKEGQLGVNARILREAGAVSEEAARAMAEGVRDRLGADYGVAITGIAGPGGGTPEKPTGRVHVAVASRRSTVWSTRDLSASRSRVRRWAVTTALDLLRRRLQDPEES
jgi:competence/damage-inducible protein CinA-like protein